MIARLIRIFRFLAGGLLILALATNLVTRPRREVEDDADQTPPEPQDVKPRLLRLLLSWVLLLVLVAVEFGASFLPMNREVRPLILIPAVLMVAAVGIVFMQVGRGPTIVRLFATAGLLWLTILLGLGSLDPLTRTDYQVQTDGSK
jgi:cytochrome c oxidase subunit 4